MDNNDLDKILRTSLSTNEIPDLNLILDTKEKLYSRKDEKTERIIILYMITMISILISLEFFICLFTFKINLLLGVIIYSTLISFVALIAFMCYYYKKSITKYLIDISVQ